MARQPLVITPELLHAAWQARRRAHWPATYEACMADALLGRLVHAQAVGLAQAAQRRADRAQPTACPALPVDRPRPPPAAPPPAPPTRAALFDPKRLAAGDHDDDD